MVFSKFKLFSLSALLFLTISQSAQAIPFQLEYNDRLSSITGFSGLSIGDAAKITITVDNGNSSLFSQTWTQADLVSVAFDFNNGGVVVTFNSPFDGGLDIGGQPIVSDFSTDAAGVLTSVLHNWLDFNVGSDFVANFTATSLSWFLNGANDVLRGNSGPLQYSIDLTNVEQMSVVDGWVFVRTADNRVPEPGVLALFGLGLAGLGLARRRKSKA